uniref:Uncharacterized protein n=1 Tax=Knipowitschia caucasica TaxID=637954 RepID=A0AAV2J650_KNICA
MHIQAEVSDGLRAVTVDVSNRVCALEACSNHGALEAIGVSLAGEVTGTGHSHNGTEETLLSASDKSTIRSGEATQPGSPKWNQVVKRRPRRELQAALTKPAAPRVERPTPGNRKGGRTVVGTGKSESIKMIKTKLSV